MKIVILGAGNVATHLGLALKKNRHEIVQVYSRSMTSAKELGGKLKCAYTNDLKEVSGKADLYVVAITDHQLKIFLKTFPVTDKAIVHTSGSTGISVFGKRFTNYGVIYPLQTFSKDSKPDFSRIPVLIETSGTKATKLIRDVAETLSAFVFDFNSEDRRHVHLAAVIANNFSNHLFLLAEKILLKKNIPFTILGPLMNETVNKAISIGPAAAQTGPAKRGDATVISEHLRMLAKDSDLKEIYRMLSESIRREQGQKL